MTSPFFEPNQIRRRLMLLFIVAIAVVTVGFLVVVLARPGEALVALRWYLIVVGALALLIAGRFAVSFLPVHRRTAFDVAWRQMPFPDEPVERLRQIERLVSSAHWNQMEYQYRLRLVLRETAAHRLAVYHGINLDREPEAAREVLGERVWTLLAPPEEPPDRSARGVAYDDLRMVVEALEKVNDVTLA